MIHTLAEVPGSRALLQHNGTREDASELYEGGSLADVVAAASAASPQQVHLLPACPPITPNPSAEHEAGSACMVCSETRDHRKYVSANLVSMHKQCQASDMSRNK